MTGNDPKFWRPLQGDRAQLVATTRCEYLEVLQYPEDIVLQKSKDAVNEVLLESWLKAV
jgi:hypothetical protein